MLVISSREFRGSQKKYLEMAKIDRVIIKRNNEYIELVPRGHTIPENPSPGKDPYFNDPENIAELQRRITALEQGLSGSTILTKEKQEELLGS